MGVERAFVECPNAGGSRVFRLKAVAVFAAAVLALVLALGFAPAPAFADEGSVGVDAATCSVADSRVLPSESFASSGGVDVLAPSAAVQVPNLTLYGVDGSVRSLEYHYNGSPYVVLCGRPGCGNTRAMISEMMFAQENGYEDVGLIVLDIDGNPSTFSSGFGKLHSNDAYFASTRGSTYSNWAWSLLDRVDPSASSSVYLPFAFIVDEDGVVQWASTGIFDVFEALETVFAEGGSVSNPSVKLDLLVEVSVDQAEARKVLAMVNAARSAVGQPALKWDEELEKAALQRAAELVVLFEHKRPDGSEIFTIFPSCGIAGENIAFGYRSAQAVNDGWTNSAGHYANMIKAGYKSMAVACVKVGNLFYWSELFTDRAGSTTLGEPLVSGSKGFVVTKKSREFSLSLDNPGELSVGDEFDFLDMVLVDDEFPLANGSALVWESDDSSVLRIGADGKAVALAPGSAQVTVSLAENSAVSDSVTVTVSGPVEPTRIEVPVPYADLVYNASAQIGVPQGEGYLLSGDYWAIEPGEYEAIAALAAGYIWADGTTDPKVIKWSIAEPEPVTYTIEVHASPAEGGAVLGAGIYEEGEEVIVRAVAADGFEFAGWMEGDTRVSTRAVYVFEIHSDRELVAEFEAIELGPEPGPDPDPELPYSDLWESFPDVKAEVGSKGGPDKLWYVRDGWLDYVVGRGLMGGYTSGANAGCFGPHDKITRASVATMLYRAACADNPGLERIYGSTTDKAAYGQTASFTDMQAGKWYTAAINWARDAGIMTGDGATNFTTVRPNDTVTRQELTVMLARYANDGDVPAMSLDPSVAEGLVGIGEMASWAKDGMFWALNEGVISGAKNSDGTRSLNPKMNAERCEAAKMFTVVLRDVL